MLNVVTVFRFQHQHGGRLAPTPEETKDRGVAFTLNLSICPVNGLESTSGQDIRKAPICCSAR